MNKVVKVFFLMLVITSVFSNCNTKSRYVDVSGTVYDADTQMPIPGISIKVTSSYTPDKTSYKSVTTSDGDGRFAIDHFKMAYPNNTFKNQKTGDLYIVPYSNMYSGEAVSVSLHKKTSAFNVRLVAHCYAMSNFSIVLNSPPTYDFGLVTYKRCKADFSECSDIAGPVSSSGVFGFYPGDPLTFSQQIYSGSNYKNIFTLLLYNNGTIVATKADTISGQPCGNNFNYTITLN